MEREERHRPWIIFHIFSCSSNMCFLAGSFLTAVRPGSHCCLYIVISRCQLTLSCLLSHIQWPLAFSFEFLSANQNSLSIRCWYVPIFNPGVLNYFTHHYMCACVCIYPTPCSQFLSPPLGVNFLIPGLNTEFFFS